MESPSCPTCKTDAHLRFARFEPRRTETVAHGAWGQRIPRRRVVEAQVEFTCEACGYFNGQSVPAGWEVPSPNPRVPVDRPPSGGVITVYG